MSTLSLTANTVRILSAEAVQKANSGHPGMPMGMADLAAVLWLKFLRFNPADPKWVNRDRFVLSNGHGSMLLYSMLHLSGYDISMDDLKNFRQWDSITPGHPESFMTPGVECTTGPLGQGIANAVGMSLGQKIFADRYNTAKRKVIDHKVYCFLGDGCLMEGISSEASSLAGHLGLNNLIAIYDSNHISIAGHTELAFTEDVAKRYEAYGWSVQSIDGHDYAQIEKALELANKQQDKPTLIVARTIIGKGSPNKADSHDSHGAPLGDAEIALVKEQLKWPGTTPFFVPDEVRDAFKKRVGDLKGEYDQWHNDLESWKKEEPQKAMAFDKQWSLFTGSELAEKLIAALPKDRKPTASRKLSSIVLQAASAEVQALIGGSADLEPSTLTLIEGSTDVQKGSYAGKNLRFGVREHGMGSIMNGLAYYGGFIPYGSTFLCFADYMRPAIRIAALTHLPAIYVFTHDSIFLGEDGPTHQPVEHLASLRVIPNLNVFRPASDVETAVCYAMSLENKKGPSALILTRQNLDILPEVENLTEKIRRGGYSTYENSKTPEIVFIATGSEVGLAVKAAKALESKHSVRVVSMPCCDVYQQQPDSYKNDLIPQNAKRIVIEAASSFGWLSILGGSSENTKFVTVDHFGASAPYDDLVKHFGFTVENVVSKVSGD